MNIAQLNKLAHGQISKKDLYPASLITNEETKRKYEEKLGLYLIDFEKIKEISNKIGIDPKNFYFTNKILTTYVYYDFPLLLQANLLDEFAINETFKEMINQQKKSLNIALRTKDFSDFFTLLNSQLRVFAFEEIYHHIPLNQKYSIFRQIYTKENYGTAAFDKKFIDAAVSKRSKEFKIRLQQKLNKITKSEEIIIYRGQGDESTPLSKAMSWTTSLDVAIKFASMFSLDGEIYQAKVKKRDVIDYIRGRGEYEILAYPNNLYAVKRLNFIKTSEEINNLQENYMVHKYHKQIGNFDSKLFFHPNGIHGMLHMKRVLLHVLSLSLEFGLDDFDMDILIKATKYHDIGRINDDKDDEHGILSWKKVIEKNLLKGQDILDNENDLKILQFIIENHCLHDNVVFENLKKLDIHESEYNRAEHLVKIFKDCDGLDRVRLGDLKTQYLRFEQSKRRVLFAKGLLAGIK